MPTILEEVSIVISTYFTLHFGVLDFHGLNFQTSLPLLEDRDLSGKDSDASPLIVAASAVAVMSLVGRRLLIKL